jgi:RNA polymerase sigma-70 factor (ECF subfamily)
MPSIQLGTRDFDGFFAEEFPIIARAAWFVVLDTEVAKEIAQEAFCRAYERWDKVAHYDRPGAWVRTVAIRLALRTRDRRRRETPLGEVDAIRSSQGRASGAAGAATDMAIATLDNVDLQAALKGLPRQQRAALVLRYLCDLDIEELAEAIGCKPATARVHLHRGRHALGLTLGARDDVR